KKPGDQIQLDDELCEVETDKAVYPIQSSFAGVMGEWKTKIDDTVEIGQELGTILTTEPALAEHFDAAAKESSAPSVSAGVGHGRAASETATRKPVSSIPATVIEPALSPTITRKLSRVIPANLQIDARWDAIQEARQKVKRTDREQGPSPSMMIAWAVVR